MFSGEGSNASPAATSVAPRELPQLHGEVGRGRNRHPLRLRRRMEQPEGAVRRPQVGGGDALHVVPPHLVEPVPIEEQQPPVADRDHLRQRERDRARVRQELLDVGLELGARALDLLVGHRVRGEALQRGEERIARRLERGIATHRRAEVHRTGLAGLPLRPEDRGRLAGGDERLVQPARGLRAEDLGEEVDGDEVRVSSRRDVVHRIDELHFADAPQDYRALAVLRRLDGVRDLQATAGLRDRPERPCDRRERARLVELSGDHEHRVVGLVVVAVERLEPLDGHVLDVGQRADDRAPVVVPEVGGGVHPLAQQAERAVLPGLELVAHDRHFALEVLPGDPGVDHPVGLDVEHEREQLVGGRKRLEIVGAIERGRAVVARAALQELALRAGVARRALEQHVLEQVRHPALAVALVTRSDEVGDVDGDRVLGGVGKEQDLEPVRQVVFADAAHRRAAADPFGQLLGGRDRREQNEERGKERPVEQRHRYPLPSGERPPRGRPPAAIVSKRALDSAAKKSSAGADFTGATSRCQGGRERGGPLAEIPEGLSVNSLMPISRREP